jgi:hypothetical protein
MLLLSLPQCLESLYIVHYCIKLSLLFDYHLFYLNKRHFWWHWTHSRISENKSRMFSTLPNVMRCVSTIEAILNIEIVLVFSFVCMCCYAKTHSPFGSGSCFTYKKVLIQFRIQPWIRNLSLNQCLFVAFQKYLIWKTFVFNSASELHHISCQKFHEILRDRKISYISR